MSLWKKIYNGVRKYYSYEDSYITQLIEEERKHKYLNDLMDVSDKIIAENPNFIEEVRKSENGCWMEQVYMIRQCPICDFNEDCPIKLDEDFETWKKEQLLLSQPIIASQPAVAAPEPQPAHGA